jgi:hypothetical protein
MAPIDGLSAGRLATPIIATAWPASTEIDRLLPPVPVNPRHKSEILTYADAAMRYPRVLLLLEQNG